MILYTFTVQKTFVMKCMYDLFGVDSWSKKHIHELGF